jgi:uncharacterized RDD family membrane protein YckC
MNTAAITTGSQSRAARVADISDSGSCRGRGVLLHPRHGVREQDPWPAMSGASGVRRSLAVFIDFFAYSLVWGAIGVFARDSSLYFGLAGIFLLDVVLTAVFGASVGRWVTGIRVARADGSRPGFVPTLIRTALTFSTGWAGLLFVTLILSVSNDESSDRVMPARLWWDAAAGTELVRAGWKRW